MRSLKIDKRDEMDTVTQDVWYIICSYLTTYEFTICSRLSKRYYSWYNADAWMNRASVQLNTSLTVEFKELFHLPATMLHVKYLYMLAWGGRVERYSQLILPSLDCLTFSLMMQDAELVEYFTIIAFGDSIVDSDLFSHLVSIVALGSNLKSHLAMIRNIKSLSSELRLSFNLSKHKLITEAENKEIFHHALRIKACSPLLQRIYSLAKKYGLSGILKVADKEKSYFCASFDHLDEIDEIEGLTVYDRFSIATGWAASRGRVKYDNPSVTFNLITDRDAFTFPNMLELWSWKIYRPAHGTREWGLIMEIRDLIEKVDKERLESMFPHIYLRKLPIVLHACGVCYHYCTDIEHQCCH